MNKKETIGSCIQARINNDKGDSRTIFVDTDAIIQMFDTVQLFGSIIKEELGKEEFVTSKMKEIYSKIKIANF